MAVGLMRSVTFTLMGPSAIVFDRMTSSPSAMPKRSATSALIQMRSRP